MSKVRDLQSNGIICWCIWTLKVRPLGLVVNVVIGWLSTLSGYYGLKCTSFHNLVGLPIQGSKRYMVGGYAQIYATAKVRQCDRVITMTKYFIQITSLFLRFCIVLWGLVKCRGHANSCWTPRLAKCSIHEYLVGCGLTRHPKGTFREIRPYMAPNMVVKTHRMSKKRPQIVKPKNWIKKPSDNPLANNTYPPKLKPISHCIRICAPTAVQIYCNTHHSK